MQVQMAFSPFDYFLIGRGPRVRDSSTIVAQYVYLYPLSLTPSMIGLSEPRFFNFGGDDSPVLSLKSSAHPLQEGG